ncbi:MAG: DUF2007 domain-containing protein [Rubrivivax sp.]|jgi:hypothetical protein|nr:DUF2007 domain-containing protein [Rubrivivax sp.]MBK8527200.1 DUF2007 domain-containing protein [Rubrivivax sp.]
MKRVLQAPNLVLATLWSDQLRAAGFTASVQRAFASGIAGELPPDQCLPEVWVQDDAQCQPARELLAQWQRLPHRHWACPQCHEIVDGPFESCWNCGAPMPTSTWA